MPGLVPGIHAFLSLTIKQDVDGRDKPGHDVERVVYVEILLLRPAQHDVAFGAESFAVRTSATNGKAS